MREPAVGPSSDPRDFRARIHLSKSHPPRSIILSLRRPAHISHAELAAKLFSKILGEVRRQMAH